MRTIRYIGTDPVQRPFAAAVRKNVTAWFREAGISQKADYRIVYKIIAMLGIYLVPYFLYLFVPMNGWMAILLAAIMGAGLAGIGMSVMHDGVHGSVSHKDWVNKLVGSSICLLGSNVFNWKIQHNVIHHTHTNVDEVDQDIGSRGILRFSEHAPLKRSHRTQHVHAFFMYGLLTITKLVNDFFMLRDLSKAGFTRDHGVSTSAEYVRMAFVKGAHITAFLVLPLVLTDLAWWQVMSCFFIMHFVAGVIMGAVFQLAHVVEGAEQPLPNEHDVIADDWAAHEMRTTSDFARDNRLLTWYIGGLNFQIEHHLFPHVSHLHYRAIAPIVERTAREYGLPYNLKPTLGAALLSHARRLKELGRTPVVAKAA